MGVKVSRLSSSSARYAAQRSASIDKELSVQHQGAKSGIKILLLGAGESGKSTVLKQMRILHGGGFNEHEIILARRIIFENVLHYMVIVLDAMANMGMSFDRLRRENDADEVRKAYNDPNMSLENAEFTCLKTPLMKLWKDKGVQRVFLRRNEYQLSDSASYFFDSLERIGELRYVPSSEDILHTSIRTTGIVEMIFTVKNFTLRIFDVGGQRTQRKKWLNCFEDVNAVQFITSLNEYDQTLSEEKDVNRMAESLRLFESICKGGWFDKSCVIIFFNKKDLFAHKILLRPLSLSFPDYKGPQEYSRCVRFIEDMFMSVMVNHTGRLYTHRTCATDTHQLKIVLDAVLDMIISINLRGFGFL